MNPHIPIVPPTTPNDRTDPPTEESKQERPPFERERTPQREGVGRPIPAEPTITIEEPDDAEEQTGPGPEVVVRPLPDAALDRSIQVDDPDRPLNNAPTR